jgi:LGFP repeat
LKHHSNLGGNKMGNDRRMNIDINTPISPIGPIGPNGENPFAAEMARQLREKIIADKWDSLGGTPGVPKTPGDSGLISLGSHVFREYANGTIYLANKPFYVYGAIGQKYTQLGGPNSWLGWPTSDELDFAYGGRVSKFEHGAIYCWSDTGAIELGKGNNFHEYGNGRVYYSSYFSEPLYLYGDIGYKYVQLGGQNSWLGWPTSADEIDFAQGGRVRTFENGAIYWWPDTGAIELGNISVQYKGFHCFGETDEWSGSDEPYVLFGVVPVPPAEPSSLRTKVYDDVDGGGTYFDNIELYRGLPYGMALGVVLMEHDEGDPDTYLSGVKQGVAAAGVQISAAAAAVPYVGPLLSIASAAVFKLFGDDIAQFFNDLLGTGDDIIENWGWNITAKEMVTMTRTPQQNFWGIEYHLESKLLSDGEASYKVYLGIYAV